MTYWKILDGTRFTVDCRTIPQSVAGDVGGCSKTIANICKSVLQRKERKGWGAIDIEY